MKTFCRPDGALFSFFALSPPHVSPRGATRKIFLFTVFFLPATTAHAIIPDSWFPQYSAHRAYQKKDYKKSQSLLEKEQVENPIDPEINYNLGTIYHQQKDYGRAQESFGRSAFNCNNDQLRLKEQSYFNQANSAYKNTLEFLGSNWKEKEEIPEPELKKASELLTQSINSYKKALKINDENEKTKTNLKAVEQLLAQLEKKQQQQQQEQKEKQDKEKQNKQQQKQKQKQKQKQQDGEQQEGEKQGKQEGNEQQEQKENAEQKEQGEANKKQEQQKAERSEEDKKENKEEQQNQPAQAQQQESLKKKEVQVLLDALQADENKLQKMLVMQKTKADKKPNNSYQKPW